jgi:peptidyl-prolyl cis-trans isomerase D
MATLNTLRTRGALFLSIVIGVSLIVFLLGDLQGLGSVFQSRRNRVGSIAGNNIDYTEFVESGDRLERVVEALYQRSSLNAQEVDQVRDMVWDRYIRRYSYEPGFRNLGVTVGEAEQIDMVQGTYTSPMIASLFGSPETGMVDRAALAQFVASLDTDQTGRMSAVWDYVKEQMTGEREMSKYLSLVRAGAFVNDLEVARGVSVANNTYSGKYAMLPFSGIADSTVTVSSSEVRDYFNKHKETFRQAASREIEYVTFEVAPSEDDFAAAATHIAEVAAEFAAAEDPMRYATQNSQERSDQNYYAENQLSGDQLAIAFGDRRGEMAGPTLTGNVYTISRVAGERMMSDSVGARHILLPAARKASADSLVTAIRGGADIFALAPLYSVDQTVDLGRFPPEMMVEPFAEGVMAARTGDVFKVDTQSGTHVVQMTYKTAPVRKVRIATVTYNVDPSPVTQQVAYNKARDFLTFAAGSRENFDALVTSTGVSRRVATIGERDRNVSGLEDSRVLVQWSFNAKPGTVSNILDIDGNHVVAVLTGAKEAGIADVSDVAQTIATRLRTEKKAATLTAQMSGRSLDEVAAMEGARSGDVTELKVGAFYDPTLGMEPAVIGVFSALAAGETSGPVKGYGGVYLVTASTVNVSEEATDASERVRLEAGAETSLPQRVMQVLNDGSDIRDYRAKFF